MNKEDIRHNRLDQLAEDLCFSFLPLRRLRTAQLQSSVPKKKKERKEVLSRYYFKFFVVCCQLCYHLLCLSYLQNSNDVTIAVLDGNRSDALDLKGLDRLFVHLRRGNDMSGRTEKRRKKAFKKGEYKEQNTKTA